MKFEIVFTSMISAYESRLSILQNLIKEQKFTLINEDIGKYVHINDVHLFSRQDIFKKIGPVNAVKVKDRFYTLSILWTKFPYKSTKSSIFFNFDGLEDV